MRALVDAARLERLMRARGDAADGATRIYFTGGATAVLYGWRASTIDVDLKIVPDSDRLYRTLPDLKERLTNKRLMTSLRCPCRASHVKGDSAR
jgi:hypothetical protein